MGAVTQPTGFSPGVAARLTADNGRRVFLKAVTSDRNAVSGRLHRREIDVVGALPEAAPVPRLLWSYDEGGWVVLVFEDVEGRHPAQPWRDRGAGPGGGGDGGAERVADAVTAAVGRGEDCGRGVLDGDSRLATVYSTKGRRSSNDVDAWSRRHIETLAAIEDTVASALVGDTLLHLDLRADNILLTDERVWFVDWPHASVGPAWLDVVALAPSVTMQGGPAPEEVIARHWACGAADGDAITAAVVSMAGYFTRQALQPPPGIPTVRAFQAAQGVVARRWVGERVGLG